MSTGDAAGAFNDGHRRGVEPHRFPAGTVFILTLAATVYCYTLASLFPYVGVMVSQLLSLDTTNEAGYYTGYVASSFTFGRILSSYMWGNFTDSFGRKPTIILGLASLATFSVTFGLSTSYAMALSSRLVLGLTNGIVPALRISVKEVCGPEDVVMGMAYLSSCKAIGMILGTGVGGLLSQPAVHYPSLFSATGVFGRYPFLLPNLVGAVCSLATLVFVVAYLPETNGEEAAAGKGRALLQCNSCGVTIGGASSPFSEETPMLSSANGTHTYQALMASVVATTATTSDSKSSDREGHQRSSGSDCEEGYAGSNGRTSGGGCQSSTTSDQTGSAKEGQRGAEKEEGDKEPGIFGRGGLLATPNVKVLLFLACVVQAIQIGFNEVYPLYALSSPDVGGLGWNSLQIGKVLLLAGVVMAVFQLGVFPVAIKIIGITTGQRVGFTLGALAFLAVPAGKSISWSFSSLYAVLVAATAVINCSMSAIVLALSVGSTTLVSSGMRGKLGGLHNTAESFGNCMGPAGFATMYAWSISSSGLASAHDWIDYRFVFHASAAVLALCAVLAWRTLTHENMIKA